MCGFDEAAARVWSARTPAELFGAADSPTAQDEAAKVYRELAKHLHPDRVPPDRAAEATRVFARLSTLWSSYSAPPLLGHYQWGSPLGRDGIADYYPAQSTRDGRQFLLKVVRRPANNDLLRRESQILQAIHAASPGPLLPYLPALAETVTAEDPSTGVMRVVNVFARTTGLVSLAAILDACPDGLDGRSVAWIWRRLLVALGIAHRAGVVHGAVVPEHVLVEPYEHGLVLSQWCYACIGDEPLPALVPGYRDWYAPEIPDRGRPTPGSDIYLATRCMTALLERGAPAPLRTFARGCLLSSPAARPDDAWRLLAELDDVLGHLYGPRRFTPLRLPTGIPQWPATSR